MIKIKNMDIKGIGPILDLNIKFDQSFNIICGQNGIGKTTILDCIAQSFALSRTSLKRHSKQNFGEWNIEVNINNQPQTKNYKIDNFLPVSSKLQEAGFYKHSKDIIVFKTHRDIPHQRLAAVSIDPVVDNTNTSNQAINGTLSNDIKAWFVNRHLWSGHPNHLNSNQLGNINLAKQCFSSLDNNINFSRVDPSSNDILLNTENGEIYLEYLSSGYKSCLAVLLGLIKEIEFRNIKDNTIDVKDFSGVIIIDEIDLHLHPEWQAKIYTVLKNTFPNAQFFTSTHSPHLIQIAEPNEIIPLVKSNQSTKSNELINSQYGCQGWTVEEILTDVMGMTHTRTTEYKNLINNFNNALENNDKELANKSYEELSLMLHPDNPLKQIMEIQMIGVGEID